MTNKELIESLISQTDSVASKNDIDKLVNRSKMIVRRVYGDSSTYLTDIEKITSISVAFISRDPKVNAQNEQRRTQKRKEEFKNLFEIMLEEIELFEKDETGKKLVQEQDINTQSSHSIFGSPINTSQFQCDIFMVMPFAETFKPIYDDHVVTVAKKSNLVIKRGDDPFSKHDIMRDIWSLTCNARLIIADCTGKNPNVLYEMGLAHALDKPIIIIAQTIEDIPFDLRLKRVIVYDYTPRGMKKFEDQLETAIKLILEDEN